VKSSDLAVKEKMIATITSHFSINGWMVRKASNSSLDLVVVKSQFEYLISCIDPTVGRFKDITRLILDMQEQTVRWKREARIILFVFHEQYSYISQNGLAARGICTVLLSELEIVSQITRWEKRLPTAISVRETALLERNTRFCIQTSDRCREVDDHSSAVLWAERAVVSQFCFSMGYEKLFRLLLDGGDIAGAISLGQKVLQLEPQNQQFLQMMRSVSLKAGDVPGAAVFEARFQQSVQQAKVRERVIRRPTSSAAVDTAPRLRNKGFAASIKRLLHRAHHAEPMKPGYRTDSEKLSESEELKGSGDSGKQRLRLKAKQNSFIKASKLKHSQALAESEKLEVHTGDQLDTEIAGEDPSYFILASAILNGVSIPADIRYALKSHWSKESL
jgi:hypothetical protein